MTQRREFGMPFRRLPMYLRRRWWEQTCYGKYPPTDELLLAIEAIDEEAAVYLAMKHDSGKDND
jgi:hypothetical protein